MAWTFRRVYVWELPVRMFHWWNAWLMFWLIVTGLAIGLPVPGPHVAEAFYGSWFGWIRLIHFVAGWLLLFNFVLRLYWGFVGNRHARWTSMAPFSWKELKRQVRQLIDVLRVDIIETSQMELEIPGHNALASWSYMGYFALMVAQILTGFALYAPMSTSWMAGLFGWVSPLLGGDLLVRQIHHVLTWVFILFTGIHVYIVLYHDRVEGRGFASAIIGGWKFMVRKS